MSAFAEVDQPYLCPECDCVVWPDVPHDCDAVTRCTHLNRYLTQEDVPAFSDVTILHYRCEDCGATWTEEWTIAEQRAEQEEV